jgi:SAM-dependent methyltransferase
MPERNISTFNSDTERHGGYVYTSVDRWSTRVATERQTDEIIRLLKSNFARSSRVADIGCGDGTYTLEIAKRFGPHSIRGIDAAKAAVDVARQRIPDELSEMISYEVGSIYGIQALPGETVAALRGVLHHLDDPAAAIKQLASQFQSVVALEPNGYNPAMKFIEKTSTYHREHDEKSYWPPRLNGWFESNGYTTRSQKSFGLVPYFCPVRIGKVLKAVEPWVERLPILRGVACGGNLMLYTRR